MNAVEAMSEVSEGLRQLLISTIMDADVPQPSLNAWHPRGLESMMGFPSVCVEALTLLTSTLKL
jgi:hypothetical protein